MSGSMYCTRASTPCEYYSTIQCEYKYRASTSYSYSYPYSYSSSTPRIKILQYPLHRTVHARLVIDPVDIYTVIGPKTSINDRRHGLAPDQTADRSESINRRFPISHHSHLRYSLDCCRVSSHCCIIQGWGSSKTGAMPQSRCKGAIMVGAFVRFGGGGVLCLFQYWWSFCSRRPRDRVICTLFGHMTVTLHGR